MCVCVCDGRGELHVGVSFFCNDCLASGVQSWTALLSERGPMDWFAFISARDKRTLARSADRQHLDLNWQRSRALDYISSQQTLSRHVRVDVEPPLNCDWDSLARLVDRVRIDGGVHDSGRLLELSDNLAPARREPHKPSASAPSPTTCPREGQLTWGPPRPSTPKPCTHPPLSP